MVKSGQHAFDLEPIESQDILKKNRKKEPCPNELPPLLSKKSDQARFQALQKLKITNTSAHFTKLPTHKNLHKEII